MVSKDKIVRGVRQCFEKKECDGCPYEVELATAMHISAEWHCPLEDDLLELMEISKNEKSE